MKASKQQGKIRRRRPAAVKSHEPDDFVSVARRLEADDDKKRFEAKLKKIAKATSGQSR